MILYHRWGEYTRREGNLVPIEESLLLGAGYSMEEIPLSKLGTWAIITLQMSFSPVLPPFPVSLPLIIIRRSIPGGKVQYSYEP